MKNNKIRVAVLYGGRSPEHEVSISSAINIMQNLDRTRFEVVPIKIDKQGSWFLESKPPALLPHTDPVSSQKLFTPGWINEPEAIKKNQITTTLHHQSERLFDVIFPVMHGTFSEDGTIQGLLELAEIPYVGCGVLSSAIGMDKDIARRLVSQAGVTIVPYLVIKKSEWNMGAAAIVNQIEKNFSLPLFVKPANQGSSIGVIKVKNKNDLSQAITKAFHYDTKVLVETAVNNIVEVEVSLMESLEDGADPFVSLVGEVRPNDEFNSYKAKYTEGGAEFVIPAEIPEKQQEAVRELAKNIFTILGAEGMARIDFFIDKVSQKIYFNEMNTIPGFTTTSMYPQQVVASGVPYSELLTQLVMLAIKKHAEKQKLERSYVRLEDVDAAIES